MRLGKVGLIALVQLAIGGSALTAGGSALAADGPADDSGRPPWAGEGQPLLFEAGVLGSLAVGGRFHLEGASSNGASADDRVTLADHGAFAVTADLNADQRGKDGDSGAQYELFYSHEATDLRGTSGFPRTDVTVEYLHLGGTLLIDDEPRIKPYIAGGLGITRLTPGVQGSTDTRFSASLGLGLRWPVTKNFAVRLEGRGFVTLVNPDASVFCRSDQSGLLCRVHGNGQTFLQGQFLAGVALAF